MNCSSGRNKKRICCLEPKYLAEKYPDYSSGFLKKTHSSMGCDRILTTTLFLAALLQAHTGSCSICKYGEITYRSNQAGQKDKCGPCIDCPDGMEPSIACGSVAEYGTLLDCVACREGTYSDTYGKEQCKPCSLCSAGRTVTRNCSTTLNSDCGSCKHGYYEKEVVEGLIYDCEPCSDCCWDNKDEFEEQCKAQGLPRHQRCKLRNADSGCQRDRVTIKLTPSPTTSQRKSTSEQRRDKLKSADKMTLWSSSTTQRSFISSIATNASAAFTSFFQASIALQRQRKKTSNEGRGKRKPTLRDIKRPISVSINSGDLKGRVIKAVIGILAALILVVCIIKRKTIANFFKWVRCRPICRSSDAEHGVNTESVILDDIKTPTNVERLGELIFMKDLRSLSSETYEKVWKRLDKKPDKTKKGDYKTVASEFLFEKEDIWELEKELHSYRSGSPSKELLESLEAKRPNLTVLEFIKVLQKSNIHRKDITELLKSYIYTPCETS